jgi:hypothetical protein
MITSHFYHGATKDSHINNRKNGWFEQKLQMYGLACIEFLVVVVISK